MMKTILVLCVVVALAAVDRTDQQTALPSSMIDSIASEAITSSSSSSSSSSSNSKIFPADHHFESVAQAEEYLVDFDADPSSSFMIFTTASNSDHSDSDHQDMMIMDDQFEGAAAINRKRRPSSCAAKCGERYCWRVKKQNVLSNLCTKSCSAKCSLARIRRLYNCTLNCATDYYAIPHFSSNSYDQKKPGGGNVVNKCYKKCIKKNK